jgi:hypothetical protein
MWLTMQHPGIGALRADALFVSALQRSDDPSTGQVRNAIAAAVHEFGGRGCAEQVAQEFGDHPETAVVRMRWARASADEAYRSCSARRSCVRAKARTGTPRALSVYAAAIAARAGHPPRPGGPLAAAIYNHALAGPPQPVPAPPTQQHNRSDTGPPAPPVSAISRG